MKKSLDVVCRILVAAWCAIAATGVVAQEYPAKPIRFIVTITPGVTQDLIARRLAPDMAKFLGQPVVVENKPGADSIIGYEYVAKQVPADGYTVATASVSNLAILPLTVKGLKFDPLKDLPPIIVIADTRLVLGSAASLPWKNFSEMVANAKANPGKFNYGSVNVHIRMLQEAFIRELGLSMVNIPYSGGTNYLQALMAPDIHFGMIGDALAMSYGEKYRPLAVTGPARLPAFPNVPTFTELGFPQVRGVSYSMNGPAGMPKVAVDRLYDATSRALKLPETRDYFAKLRLEIHDLGPEAAVAELANEALSFAAIARKIGVQAQ